MNANLFHTSALASAAFAVALVLIWSSPAASAAWTDEPQLIVIASGIDAPTVGVLNGLDTTCSSGVLILTKGKKDKPDDAPKPHGPFHKKIETLPSDESASAAGEAALFARGRKGGADDDPKPEGPDDRRIRNPLGGNQSASVETLGIHLAKGKKARNAPAGATDAPVRNTPHAPGQAHG